MNRLNTSVVDGKHSFDGQSRFGKIGWEALLMSSCNCAFNSSQTDTRFQAVTLKYEAYKKRVNDQS